MDQPAHDHISAAMAGALSAPLDPAIADLLARIEACPALYIGNDTDLHALYHFLNGWQTAREAQGSGDLNGRMNAYLALRYHDPRALNWLHLIEAHEQGSNKVSRFFALYHEMQGRHP